MALPGPEGPTWKLQRAIANTYAPLRGVLLILNVLLYAICPVSAVAALPRDPFGSPPYYNSTTLRFPKWHTGSFATSSLANSTTANSSLSTWGSTFTSGFRLVTFFSVHTAQGHPSSSGFHRLPFASQSLQNISILPLSANLTHRRDGTTPMSPSPSRYFRPGHHEATTMRHYTNLTSWSTPILSSSSLIHQEANSSHHSASNASLPAFLSRNTTRAHHVTTTADLSLAKTSSISSGKSSTLPSWSSSGPRLFTPSSNSSLSGNITRAHGNITTADASLVKNSSMSSGVLSAPLSPLSSMSQSFMSPPHTGSLTQVSGPSSLPSRARYGLLSASSSTKPSASSSTHPSRSRSASITPKPSTTPTPSVTSDPSSLTNNLTYSLPPGCKLAMWEDETFVLVPTERARVAYPHPPFPPGPSPSKVTQAGAVGYDDDPPPYYPDPPPSTTSQAGDVRYSKGPASSTTSQAGAAGYPNPTPPIKDPAPPLDKQVAKAGPSAKTVGLALGLLLGIFPSALGIPIVMWDLERWRLEKDKREGRIRKIPKNQAEDMQDIYDQIRNRKWNERLAVWLEDFRGWSRATVGLEFPTLREKTIKKDIKRDRIIRRILRINAYQGPTFTDKVGRLKNPTERDPAPCNYNTRAEMRGCLDPPLDWPIYNTEGPPRLTHEESLGKAEQLHRPVKSQKIMNGVMKTILKLPEGYERLTLDGKMSYLKQWTKITVSDPRLRFYDGRCAAVGPGNMPLGGQDVDKLWFNEQTELTMKGTKVEPESVVGEMTDMVSNYETARFVRQNFPTERFEGVEVGSEYDSMYDRTPPVEPNQGKGKGKAKASTVEELNEGLTFPQKQAMDMQMDHDLQDVSDEIIKKWWNDKYLDAGPSQVPPIEDMRTSYWSENARVGPKVGDYTEWGSQPTQSPPHEVEIREPPSSPSSPNRPNNPKPPKAPPNSPNLPPNNPPNTPVGPDSPLEPNSPSTQDAEEQAKQAEEQIRQQEEQARQAEKQAERARQKAEQARQKADQARQKAQQARQKAEQAQQAEYDSRYSKEHMRQVEEQLRKMDEQIEDEAEDIQEMNRRIRQEEARQKMLEQLRDADKQMHKEEALRRVEARMQKNAEDMKRLGEELRKSDYRMRANQAEEARARQQIKEWQKEYQEAQKQAEQKANQKAKQGKNEGGKPSKGKGQKGNGGA